MDKLNQIKEFLLEQKKKILLVSLLLLVFFTIGFLTVNTKKNNKEEKIVFENVYEEKQESNQLEEFYYIDVKGQVNVPGVYSIEKGKRVVDAINIAGGLKENADTSLLNLSMLLKDQMVIIVYSTSEIKDLENTLKKETIKNTICKETVVNDSCIVNNKETIVVPEPIIENKIDNTFSKEDFNNLASEKVNINTASKEILMTLSKIGESKANAIIEYREKNGLFKNIEEIKEVSGIGDTLFESIKDYITV